MLRAVGEGIVTRRKTVVIAMVALAIGLGCGLLDLRVGFQVRGFFESSDPELQAAVAHYGEFEVLDRTLLIAWDESEPLAAAAIERVRRLSAVAAAAPLVRQVLSLTSVRLPGPFATPAAIAASSTYRDLLVSRQRDAVACALVLHHWRPEELRALIDRLQQEAVAAGVELRFCGLPYHTIEAMRLVRSDMRRFLPIGTAISAVFLFWLVPHLALALLALLVVPLVLVSTLGLMALCGVEISMLTSTLPTLLLCMSIADGVHMVGRFLEQRRLGQDSHAAAVGVFATMFTPCLLTSLTTVIGFLGLLRADLGDLRQLGVFAAVGMLFAFVYTVTILPAAMSWVHSLPRRRRDPGDWVLAGARLLLRPRPRWWLAVALAVLGGGALLTSRLQVDHRITGDLWPDSAEMTQMRYYESRFVGIVPAEILVEAEGGFDDDALGELGELCREIELRDDVARTLSIADLHADGVAMKVMRGLAMLRMLPASLLDRAGTTARVIAFRGDHGTMAFRSFVAAVERTAARYPGLRVRVVGTQRIGTEQVERMTRDLGGSFFGSIAVIFILVWCSCRRLHLAIVAVLSCLVPLLAVLGGMALVGVTLRPLVVIAFCIAIGLMI
ncbi:MAG: MMPL family transporter, partial [Planctomycetes bacterium]|nr:MMPL family transporter [Planctomycetota bacterium]